MTKRDTLGASISFEFEAMGPFLGHLDIYFLGGMAAHQQTVLDRDGGGMPLALAAIVSPLLYL